HLSTSDRRQSSPAHLRATAYLLTPYTSSLFFFHTPPPPEIYTLSLHDALPIFLEIQSKLPVDQTHRRKVLDAREAHVTQLAQKGDRKSTRLNSSHLGISYAVFCLKKKK